MMLASHAIWILSGLTLAAAGLAAGSVLVLVWDIGQRNRDRDKARRTLEKVAGALEPTPEEVKAEKRSRDELIEEAERALRNLQGPGDAEQFGKYISGADAVLKSMREWMAASNREEVHNAALDLTIDQVNLLNTNEESQVAALLGFFDAADGLNRQIEDRRRIFRG